MSAPRKFPSIDLEAPCLGERPCPVPVEVIDAARFLLVSPPCLWDGNLDVLLAELSVAGLYDMNVSPWENAAHWVCYLEEEGWL